MSPAMKPVEVATRSVDDVYLIRDDLAQSYNPANALERMLITLMAQSWLRLQRAHAAEERYFKTHEVLDAITNDFDRYKAITRLVTDCERAWRHAMLAIEKAQRRRRQAERTSLPPRRRPQPEPHAEFDPSLAPLSDPGCAAVSDRGFAAVNEACSAARSDPASAATTESGFSAISGAGTPACSRLSRRPPQPTESATSPASPA